MKGPLTSTCACRCFNAPHHVRNMGASSHGPASPQVFLSCAHKLSKIFRPCRCKDLNGLHMVMLLEPIPHSLDKDPTVSAFANSKSH
eukprot:569475-Pelagomonas_calceolata.AAC.3